MVNRAPRNASLLAQVSPKSPFLPTAQRAFEILATFERDIAAVGADRRWSAEGKRNQAKEIVQKALHELSNAVEKPIDAHRRETANLRSGMKQPAYDKADVVGAMNRRELRDRSVAMSFGQRTALMSGPKRDPNFVDAICEQPAWVSGFNTSDPNEAALYEEARQSRLRDLNPGLADALTARNATEAEIMMIANIVRADIASDAADLGRAAV